MEGKVDRERGGRRGNKEIKIQKYFDEERRKGWENEHVLEGEKERNWKERDIKKRMADIKEIVYLCPQDRERKREGEREREKERETETDRQTYRQTDRQTDRESDRETDKQTETNIENDREDRKKEKEEHREWAKDK